MMAAGIRQRHGLKCGGKGRCSCPWEAFVYSKADAKKIRKSFPTRAAAVAWRDDSRSAVRNQTMRAPTSEALRQAAEGWLRGAREGLHRSPGGDPFKPKTIRDYEAALRLHMLPEFGHRRLTDITRMDLQDYVDRMHAEGVNASTISGWIMPLRGIYRRALSRGEAQINPTAGLQMPRRRGGRDRIASPEECERLLGALAPADRPLWATAFYGGLRRGELRALRIEDVDLARGLIHVRRGWDEREGEIQTKNRGERAVPIAVALRDYLDEHLLNLDWKEGLIFGATASSPFTTTATMNRAKGAWKAAALEPITMHECRHTFASLMIAANVNAKALSEYMGHANIAITFDRYGHLMPGNEDEAAGLLDAYLQRADTAARLAQLDDQTGAKTGASDSDSAL
jgi:integrase